VFELRVGQIDVEVLWIEGDAVPLQHRFVFFMGGIADGLEELKVAWHTGQRKKGTSGKRGRAEKGDERKKGTSGKRGRIYFLNST
jgi:hypothetical protein